MEMAYKYALPFVTELQRAQYHLHQPLWGSGTGNAGTVENALGITPFGHKMKPIDNNNNNIDVWCILKSMDVDFRV